TRNPWRLLSLLVQLRRCKFDLMVNLTEWRGAAKMKRDATFFYLAGIRERMGFSIVDGELRRNADGMAEHEAARLLRRISSLVSLRSFVANPSEAFATRDHKELACNPQIPSAMPLDLTNPASYRFDLTDADRQWAEENLTTAGVCTEFL